MKIFITLIVALLFVGCGYDSIGLEGKWKLVRTTVPDPPGAHNVTDGAVTWTFNEAARKISIEDRTDPDNYNIKTVSYTILKTDTINDKRTLFAESNLGYVYLTKDTLTISQHHVDGPEDIFIR